MAKSSDYKTIAKGIAAYWVRAQLLSDESLRNQLGTALDRAIRVAKELEIAEVKAKAEGS